MRLHRVTPAAVPPVLWSAACRLPPAGRSGSLSCRLTPVPAGLPVGHAPCPPAPGDC
nr:MAG TPA: hypothetical protein [Caudoviricetes sp.]